MSITINENDIIISNISNYNIEYDNGNMILKRKTDKPKFDLTENFTGSKIISCFINNINTKLNKYGPIIYEIYKLFDKEFILNSATIKCTDGKNKDKAHYYYIQELDISTIRVNANSSINEIVHLTKLTGTQIKLEIELANKKIVTYEN